MFTLVRMQIRLSADSRRVFDALTQSEAVSAWFAEHTEIDLAAGIYRFWGRFTPDAPDYAAGAHRIAQLEAGQLLAYDWHVKGHDTRVTFTLIPDGDGTIVLLRHAQIEGGAEAESAYSAEDFWFLALENLRRFADGRASDARVDFTDPMRGDIRHETEIDAPAARVFDVLTNPDALNRWIATDAKVEPVVGGSYNYGWLWEGNDAGASKIIDITPDVRLSVRTEDGGPDYPPTVITWELSDSGGRTRVIFTHSGFADDADVSGMFTGWRAFLNYVRSLAEYGLSWIPPVPVLAPEAIAYPKITYAQQAQLRDELKAS